MSRLAGLACAAVFLAVTGCTMESVHSNAAKEASPNEKVLGGSPLAVATEAQMALDKLNIKAMLTSKGDSVRLAGSTRNGQPFVLVFDSRKSEFGEGSAIHVEWTTNNIDNTFWLDFVSALDGLRESHRNAAQVSH
jgi:hypothetical protein